MKLTVVPSAVGCPDSSLQYAISYVLNDTVAIDAGAVGQWMTPAEQARIRHVLISHTHMDHVASLPYFLENTFVDGPDCAAVYGSQATLLGLQEDVFNHRLWPDFVALGDVESPFLRLVEIEPFVPIRLDGLTITPIPMDHVVPTLGFVVDDGDGAVAVASDTAPMFDFWNAARALTNLRAVFLEASFPNEQAALAKVSRHLTPELFAGELDKLGRPEVPVYAVHLKPKFYERVRAELLALNRPQIHIAVPGETYFF